MFRFPISSLLTILPLVLIDGASAQAGSGAVVAVVDGVAINSTQLAARAGAKLLRLKTDEYNIQLAILNEYVDEVLLAREAGSRHISVEELLQREITSKLPQVSETEARAVIESAPTQYQRLGPDEAVRVAINEISGRRRVKLRADLLASLRARYSFQIMLQPPRLTRGIEGGQSQGPANAPIAIAEFADFQCPYCGNLSVTLQRILKEYPNQIRLTYKQFPLPSHPQAAKAAQASLCAAEQGKFWEMHDALFSEQRLLSAEAFGDLAMSAKLDLDQFDTCFKVRRFSAEVSKDMAEAISLGINSTPTTFINGQMVVGNKPYEVLRGMVEAELKRLEKEAQ